MNTTKPVLNLFKKSKFSKPILVLVVVAVQFLLAYFKKQTGYRSEILHGDWNP